MSRDTQSQWREADIYADWNGHTYKGEILRNERWNGFVIPRFSKAEAQRVVADQEVMWMEIPEDAERLEWDGDNIKVTSQYDDGDTGFINPDADGMYAIGGWGWVWTEAE